MDASPAAMTREQLAQEVGVLTWPELQRHFARGVVIVVAASLDWLDVGLAMAQDDAGRLAEWMVQGVVFKANDECARRWSVDQTPLRAVVVAPWVLVQELRPMSPIPAIPIH
jgi:hypothetical protein